MKILSESMNIKLINLKLIFNAIVVLLAMSLQKP